MDWELIIYGAAVGTATAIWLLLGRWAWFARAKLDSLVFLFLAGVDLYAMAVVTSRIFGDFIVIPIAVALVLVPNLILPPILILRAWRRFRSFQKANPTLP